MSIAYGFPRLFLANSRFRKVASISPYATGPIRCVRLSPNGKFLAVGSDDGILEIRMYEDGSWRRVSFYTGGTAIRAMVWHPVEPATIFFGSASGNIHKIVVIADGVDFVCDANVSGFVHVLSLSADGRTLAIAHGNCISVIKDPFQEPDDLGTQVDLEIESTHSDFLPNTKIPRGVYFLPGSENVILVSFLGNHDLCAFSAIEYSPVWSISLRPGSVVGSSAISPSGERLAVLNMIDGIDFYSISHRRYISTTFYNISRRSPVYNVLVDMIFVDEETVAFGHTDGHVAFATFGMNSITGKFKPNGDGVREPLQTITFGITDNLPHIFGLVSSTRTGDPNLWISDIHIGRMHAPDNIQALPELPPPPRHEDLPQLQFTRKQMCFVLLGLLAAVLLAMILSADDSQAPFHSNSASPFPQSGSDLCFCTISGSFVSNTPPK